MPKTKWFVMTVLLLLWADGEPEYGLKFKYWSRSLE